MTYAQCRLTCVMWFEMQNIRLPCKGIQVVDLVVLILVTVSQIHNVVSSSRGGKGILLDTLHEKGTSLVEGLVLTCTKTKTVPCIGSFPGGC